MASVYKQSILPERIGYTWEILCEIDGNEGEEANRS